MNSKNSHYSHPWKCTGTKENPHPEMENNGDQCSLNGCGVSRPYSAPPIKKDFRKYVILLVGGKIIAIVAVGYGLYQLFKPCPPDYQKEGFICVEQNIFRNPNRE